MQQQRRYREGTIVALAARLAVPAIYENRGLATEGSLMSYAFGTLS